MWREEQYFPIRPRLSLTKFPTKIRNKRKENKQQSFCRCYLIYFLWSCDDESEVETNDVLDEDDNNRAHDYSECTIPRYFPDEFKCHFRMTRQAVYSRGHTGHIARIAYVYFGLTF